MRKRELETQRNKLEGSLVALRTELIALLMRVEDELEENGVFIIREIRK